MSQFDYIYHKEVIQEEIKNLKKQKEDLENFYKNDQP